MTHAPYRKLTTGLLAAWFLFALSASALHRFRGDTGRPPIAIGLAALSPIVLFALGYARSDGFREFALSLSPRVLTYVQSWRILGFIFVLLYANGLLAGLFALPAGLGDMAIGATAPFIARYWASPAHRRRFILWQVLGIADLVMAVGLGVTVGFIHPPGPGTDVMSVLPLSLVPTFIVPLLLIFHIICIGQARRWRAEHKSFVLEQAA